MKLFLDIFRELENATTDNQKVAILRENASPAMYEVLRYAYHPKIKLYTNKVPSYVRDEAPDGLAFSHLYSEIRRFPAIHESSAISPERKEQILVQVLESLGSEAPLMEQIIKRKFDSVSEDVVEKAFPGLLELEQVKA